MSNDEALKDREFMLTCIYQAYSRDEDWLDSPEQVNWSYMNQDPAWEPAPGYLFEAFHKAKAVLLEEGYVEAGPRHLVFPRDLMEKIIADKDFDDPLVDNEWYRSVIREYGWDIKVD